MSYKGFYRYIQKVNDSYQIVKDNQQYGSYHRLEDALYERDRLMQVDWDLDLSMELPETINGYIHITLPPFDHKPSYISCTSEYWRVYGKGKIRKYLGKYPTLEEAKKVARIYNANITHIRKTYVVTRTINHKKVYFGQYKTYEDAKRRVEELEKNGWKK